MVYAPNTWKDRATEKSRTFAFPFQDNGDGTVTLVPVTGVVYEAGTPVKSVNMNKLEQGVAGALPVDGSGAMTGDLNINKNRAHVVGLVDYLFASAKYESHLCTNCYFDGARFHRYDTAVGAAILVPTRTGNVEVRIAGPGPNPIVWVSENVVWHSGNDGAGSGLDADLVRGYVPVNKAGDAMTGQLGVSAGTYGNTLLYIGDGGYGLGAVGGALILDSPSGVVKIHDAGVGETTVWNTGQLRDNGGVLEFFTSGAWRAVGGVKNVQRGQTSISGDTLINVGIVGVNLVKSYVSISQSTDNTQYSSVAKARLTSSTNIEFTKSNGAANTIVNWEVIEGY